MAFFSNLKDSDLQLLADKATELGFDVNFLEKDYYAVHLIKCLQVFSVKDGSFIFTGGTALAKGYKRIERFSEDCDFILLQSDSSRKDRSKIKDRLLLHLEEYGFKVKSCDSKNESKNWLFNIEYERLSPALKGDSLRPELKLEIVHKETIKIKDLKSISVQSFLAEAKQDSPEVEAIECLSIEEICAGKLSALIWRYLLEEPNKQEPQQIRHLYDIALLADILSGNPQFGSIVIEVIEKDLEERANSQLCKLSEVKKKMWEELAINQLYKDHYQTYVENYIYGASDEQLSFEQAVKQLKGLVESLFKATK